MPAQSLYFLGEDATRIEFHIEPGAGADGTAIFSLDSRFNPRREPDLTVHPDGESAIAAIAARVAEHFPEYGTRLTRIRCRHEPRFVTIAHLTQFAVPIYHDDTGER